MQRSLIHLFRLNILFLGWFWILSGTSYAQIESQLEDFNFLKDLIYTKEGRLDLNQPKDSIDAAFDRLEDSLQIERSMFDQYRLYAMTISKLSSGHTQIHPSDDLRNKWYEQEASLPFDYYMVGNRLIVSRTSPDDLKEGEVQAVPAGAELISIDGRNLHEMMGDISPYLSSDENEVEFKYFQAALMFEFFRNLATPSLARSVIPVSYKKGDDTISVDVKLSKPPSRTIYNRMRVLSNRYSKLSWDQGRFKILENEYGYFRFKSFDNCGGRRYNHFLKTSFKEIKDRGIDRLIVDVRGNTGGQMQYEFMSYIVGGDVLLGKYIVEKPYRRSDKRFFKKSASFRGHKRLTKFQTRDLRKNKFNDGKIVTDDISSDLIFKGDIVVITDYGTFSAASMLACHLKLLAGAFVIGSRPGGTYYTGNAGSILSYLPNSQFEVYVNPNSFYSQIHDQEKSDIIKNPDLEIDPNIINTKRRDQYFINEAKKQFDQLIKANENADENH